MAPPSRLPLSATIDYRAVSVRNGFDASNAVAQAVPDITAIRNVADLVVSPSLTDIIPDAILDSRISTQTVAFRSDTTQTITQGLQLRGGIFVNYSTQTLYLQIHGVTPEPLAAVVPPYPPIPVAPGQMLILDQALLGVDGFGYNATSIRVSTTLIGYTPTPGTAGLWAGIFRFKGAS